MIVCLFAVFFFHVWCYVLFILSSKVLSGGIQQPGKQACRLVEEEKTECHSGPSIHRWDLTDPRSEKITVQMLAGSYISWNLVHLLGFSGSRADGLASARSSLLRD